MSHFHPVRVKEVRRETADAVSVVVEPVSSGEDFQFQAGQYLNFKFEQGGEEYRRSYSICSAPHENEIRIAVKQVPDGRISVFFNSVVKEGDTLYAMTPEGNFTAVTNENNRKHYVFFAAGSGITPIYSLIKDILFKEPQSRCTLFFGNRSAQSIIFKEGIDQLASVNSRFQVYHILSDSSSGQPLFSGRINFGKASELLYNFCSDELPKEFFICGPSGMMTSVINALEDSGVSREQIHSEFFSAPVTDVAQAVIPTDNAAFEGIAKVQVILDDEEFDFELAAKGVSVLDAVLDQGADAPFSCKGGVCTTCRAKLLSGKVRMDSNFALTDKEIQAGFILTCQSHPDSAEIVVSYDE